MKLIFLSLPKLYSLKGNHFPQLIFKEWELMFHTFQGTIHKLCRILLHGRFDCSPLTLLFYLYQYKFMNFYTLDYNPILLNVVTLTVVSLTTGSSFSRLLSFIISLWGCFQLGGTFFLVSQPAVSGPSSLTSDQHKPQHTQAPALQTNRPTPILRHFGLLSQPPQDTVTPASGISGLCPQLTRVLTAE